MKVKYKIISVLFVNDTLPSKYILKVPRKSTLNGSFTVYLRSGEMEADWLAKNNISSENIIKITFDCSAPIHYKLNKLKEKCDINYKGIKREFKKPIVYHVIILKKKNQKPIKILYPIKSKNLYDTKEKFDIFYNNITKKLEQRFKSYIVNIMIKGDNKRKLVKEYKGRLFHYKDLFSIKKDNKINEKSHISDRLVCIKHNKSGMVLRIPHIDTLSDKYDMSEYHYTTKSHYKRALLYEYRSKNKGVAYKEEDFNKKYRDKQAELANKPSGPNKFQSKKKKTVSPLKRRRIKNNNERFSISKKD